MPDLKIFFAYPSEPAEVGRAVAGAQSIVARRRISRDIHLWEENDISGRPLTDPIFEQIAASNIVFADISKLNFNVTFEIGYAIGSGKRVYLTRNQNFRLDSDTIEKIGIFDTLGFTDYSDEGSLANILADATEAGAMPLQSTTNAKAPIYVLMTPTSNQAMLAISGRVKKTRLGYKSFIPEEEIRLSAMKAVDAVTASLGTVIPLLPPQFADASVHNIRAAFIAGLSLALRKATLILQPVEGPAPIDVRDLVSTFERPDDIANSVAEFALEITERLQADDPVEVPVDNFLASLSIGDPIAENELQTLRSYYLRTDQFGRASRGEVNIVLGRKGAGKTALFSQLRDEKRSNVRNITVDLKPEGYQLIRLKEDVLDYLAEGARTHLITAFFEYVLYLEISYKVLEKDSERHKRDGRLYEPYRRLAEAYSSGDAGEGDFSERLLSLSNDLVGRFRKEFGKEGDQRLTAGQVTELVYKHNIREVREALSAYLEFKDSVWVLFDNLDKGWSTHGLTPSDVLIVRSLIDSARKIQREMRGQGHDFHCLLFVRNDVYQLLVEASADYGKESRAVLDWTDGDLLREMLRRRFIANGDVPDVPFERIWSQVCISHYQGEETSELLIERSLMRPRNLLKMLGHCRGFAVNLGRDRIMEGDLEKGLKAYSLDLITEADQELTDIIGRDTALLYHFINEGEEFEPERLNAILMGADIGDENLAATVDFLLYYGFFGIRIGDEEPRFIFNVGYDMKILKVLTSKNEQRLKYVLNPAFQPGLNI